MSIVSYGVCAVLPIALIGCVAFEDEIAIGTDSQAATSSNKMALNKMALNNLTLGKLAIHKLAQGPLAAGPGILDSASTRRLEQTENGREVLQYLIRCALDEGDALVTDNVGITYTFPGLLGLAPGWAYRAPSKREVVAVSSCLLAHGNHFGVSVPISLRMGERLPVSKDERERFVRHEAAFFGNIFAKDQPMYACWADTPPDFSVSYPDHDPEAGDRLLRRCADQDPDKPGATLCGLTYLGPCSDVCDSQNENGYLECWTDKERTDTMYRDVMSVWLLSYDDSSSVWPEHYDEVYGP